jgi:hypothetical protein
LAQPVEDLLRGLSHLAAAQKRGSALPPQEHVLGRGELRHERELLIYDADAAVLHGRRIAHGKGRAVQPDVTRVGYEGPGQDLYQRRLAGAVLADQGMDLSALDVEIDALQGADSGKPLRDASDLEKAHRPAPRTPPLLRPHLRWV